MKQKILFVCLGNICRSPSAEAVFAHYVNEKGLADQYLIESAGISGYHQGELPDARMRSHAARRGYKLESLSRQVRADDFDHYDLIIAMDHSNRDALRDLAPSLEGQAKIRLMTDFMPDSLYDHVPDPYYGGAEGFELVLDMLEEASAGLFAYTQSIQDELK